MKDRIELKLQAKLYHYVALVTDVYDGDTITVDIDLGLNIWRHNKRIRFWKLNAPEIRGPERPRGLEVRDFVRDLIENKFILLRTILDRRGDDSTEKFGRLLGEILVPSEDEELLNLNQLLLDLGMAEPINPDGTRIRPAQEVIELEEELEEEEEEAAATRGAAPRLLQFPPFLACVECGEQRLVLVHTRTVAACPNCLDAPYPLLVT